MFRVIGSEQHVNHWDYPSWTGLYLDVRLSVVAEITDQSFMMWHGISTRTSIFLWWLPFIPQRTGCSLAEHGVYHLSAPLKSVRFLLMTSLWKDCFPVFYVEVATWISGIFPESSPFLFWMVFKYQLAWCTSTPWSVWLYGLRPIVHILCWKFPCQWWFRFESILSSPPAKKSSTLFPTCWWSSGCTEHPFLWSSSQFMPLSYI